MILPLLHLADNPAAVISIEKTTIFQCVKRLRALPRVCAITAALANRRRGGCIPRHHLDNHRFHGNGLKGFSQADHARVHRLRRPQIHHQHMVGAMMNQLIQRGDQFGVPLTVHAALKDRQLQPFSIALHRGVNRPPAFLIADVVGDQIKVFGHTGVSTAYLTM